jgi:hypothetical protein
MTYEFLMPFMKGIHLTADAWRPGRTADGWKAKSDNKPDPPRAKDELEENDDDPSDEEMADCIRLGRKVDSGEIITEDDLVGYAEAPEWLKPVPRLESDLDAMERLLAGDTPVMVPIRPVRAVRLVYGFGDASGEGFGSGARVVQDTEDDEPGNIRVRRGFWCTEISERASNYREFHNLLDAIKDMGVSIGLEGAVVYLFTDNSTSEGVYYKGTSTSAELFELMMELRLLALRIGFTVHIIHIAGTRMIAQGTDGLSRGELQLGALLDEGEQVVPLHLSPTERIGPGLLDWVHDWTQSDASEIPLARPLDWIHNAHKPGFWIWALPPAAALYALEELATARLKRMEEVGAIVLVPSLMKPDWFRRFCRTVDFYFTIPAGCAIWPASMHESLTVGLVLPLHRCEPWSWKEVGFVVALGRALSAMHSNDYISGRNLLQKFWRARARCEAMSECVVRTLLQRPNYHPFLSLSGEG